jgi:hypothetical protein
MVDVVGLRFVTEGQKEALSALREYENETKTLADLQNKHVATMNRALAQREAAERKAAQASARARREMEVAAQREAATQGRAATQAIAAQRRRDAEERRLYQNLLRYQREKEAAAQREVAAQERAATQAIAAQNRRDAEDRRALTNYLRYQREKEAAAQKEAATQARAAQETARAQQLVQAETAMLARAYNPAMAAAEVYERQVTQLNRAHALGVLSADQLEAKLGELSIAYAQVGQSTARAQNFVNQFGAVTQIAGIKTNRFGMVAQQVGYQVGDFFVQIQSGTNGFVAFGQQATQLAGLLPGLAGAVVGISIAIGTTLLAAWSRTKAATDEASIATKGFEERVKSLDNTVKDWLLTREAASRGLTVEELTGVTSVDKALADLREAEKAVADLRALTSQKGVSGGRVASAVAVAEFGKSLFGVDTATREAAAIDALAKAEERLANLRAKNDEERRTQDAERFTSIQAAVDAETQSLQQRLDLLRLTAQFGAESVQVRQREAEIAREVYMAEQMSNDILGSNLTAVMAIYDEIVKTEAVTAAIAESEAQLTAALTQQYALYAKTRTESDALTLDRVDRLATLQQELALQLAINQYGADSVEVAAMQRAAHEATLRAQENVTEEIIRAEMALYDATNAAKGVADASGGITSQLNGAANAVSTMNARLNTTLGRIRGIIGAIGSIGFDILATKAETAALTAGASEGQAAIEGEMARRSAELSDVPTALRNAVILAERKAREDLLAAQTAREAALPGDAGGGGGGGGSAQELATLTSITDAMLLRIERERELMGLQGIARRERELTLEIEEQLRQSGQMATEEAIQNAAREIAAREAVNETIRQQQSEMERIGKLLESSMTDAFMSIVDGTKSAEDAFKDMARLIIAELYKVLVVQQLVGSFNAETGVGTGIAGFLGKALSGVLGNANGNAFMGGNVVPFARGGVVGSPTMFPMAGGRTGLMGEAGPEAIMPLKRGKDGKLGVASEGGGNVSIVQHFNVSANGDESVKRIVAQQLVGQFKSIVPGLFGGGGGGGTGALGLPMPFANGGAFMGGNVVPFARGGVVGSPTMFPMAGGRTGLMGEAGPEAIMPLKRGKDGKLGVASEGNGTTTVNNYFSVSANGDESVKRIVAQQVPAIAEATKAAVMDARQRGGKMRATFR